jgi:hypothetical protein
MLTEITYRRSQCALHRLRHTVSQALARAGVRAQLGPEHTACTAHAA